MMAGAPQTWLPSNEFELCLISKALSRWLEALDFCQPSETAHAFDLVLRLTLIIFRRADHYEEAQRDTLIQAAVFLTENCRDGAVHDATRSTLIECCSHVLRNPSRHPEDRSINSALLNVAVTRDFFSKDQIYAMLNEILLFSCEAMYQDRERLSLRLTSEILDIGRVILAETQSNEFTDVSTPLASLLLFLSNELATTWNQSARAAEKVVLGVLRPYLDASNLATSLSHFEAAIFVAKQTLFYYNEPLSNTPLLVQIINERLIQLPRLQDTRQVWSDCVAVGSMARAIAYHNQLDYILYANGVTRLAISRPQLLLLISPILESLATRASEEDLWDELPSETEPEQDEDLFLVTLSQHNEVLEALCKLIFDSLEEIDDEEAKRVLFLRPLRVLLPLLDLDTRQRIMVYILQPLIKKALAPLPIEDGMIDGYHSSLDELLALMCIAANGLPVQSIYEDFTRLYNLLPEFYDSKPLIARFTHTV